MRIIIYDKIDHEPITAIKLSRKMMILAKERRILQFYTTQDLDISPYKSGQPPREIRRSIVTLRFEPIYKDKEILMWLAYADDTDAVLSLKSVFLSGQYKALNEAKKEAFVHGFFGGLIS